MTDKCDEHSRLIKECMIKQAHQEEAVNFMRENHAELKDAFWKVENSVRQEIKEGAEKTARLQVKTAVLNTTVLILFGIGNAIAIRMIISFLK